MLVMLQPTEPPGQGQSGTFLTIDDFTLTIIITHSPQLTLGLTLGVVCCVGLGQVK